MKWNLSPANVRCCFIETRSIRSHSCKPNTKNHFHHVFIKVQVQTGHSSSAVSSNPAAAAVSATAKPKAHVKSKWPSYQQDCIRLHTLARCSEHLLFLLTWHLFLPVLLRASDISLKTTSSAESMTRGGRGSWMTAPRPVTQIWWFSSPHSFDRRDTTRDRHTTQSQLISELLLVLWEKETSLSQVFFFF